MGGASHNAGDEAADRGRPPAEQRSSTQHPSIAGGLRGRRDESPFYGMPVSPIPLSGMDRRESGEADMETRINRQWRLAARPEGMVGEEHFRWVEEPAPELAADGQLLVRTLYLSCDPTQRGWMARDTYLPAVAIGEVMRSFGAGTVVESRHPRFAAGQLVQGQLGWQDFALLDGNSPGLSVVPDGIEIPIAMSVLGITGLTAYFGLLEIGRPRAGETVVVSAAAGATGSVAGQIARLQGCRASPDGRRPHTGRRTRSSTVAGSMVRARSLISGR
jgi:hypothetical protein